MSNDDDDLNLDSSFDEFEKKEGTSLGDLWRDNPMVKIGVVVAAAIAIFAVIILFGGSKTQLQQSQMEPGPDITATPGSTEAPKAIVEAIQEVNEKSVEDAQRLGESALPIPIDPPVGVIAVPEEEADAEDPLQRWRRLQEERLQRELEQRETTSAKTPNPEDTERAEAVARLADSMLQQMSSILEKRAVIKLSSKALTDPAFLEKLKEEKEAEAKTEDEIVAENMGTLLLPAGEILYAQMLTEANTDSPGPVLAEIMSGPLKGNRILGTFEEQEELLTLNFDTVVVDGESISIDAVALDPDTTLPGMATEVDHRYLRRIVLPAAAAFVEGMASAISESGATTVTVSSGGDTTTTEDTSEQGDEQEVSAGIEEAGQELREILEDMASDTKIMVKIHAGTPMGILFLEPVIKDKPEEEEEDPLFYEDLISNEQIPLEQLLGGGIQSGTDSSSSTKKNN
jgi:intracellular multiplication protein IcmE